MEKKTVFNHFVPHLSPSAYVAVTAGEAIANSQLTPQTVQLCKNL